jgi:hypothetical protein
MPQIASVTINDGATTPVAHTYVPKGVQAGVGTVEERAAVTAGNAVLTFSHNRSANRLRARIRGRWPVVQTETINGVSRPVVVRESACDLSFSFDAGSTLQERKDCLALIRNFLAESQPMAYKTIVECEEAW